MVQDQLEAGALVVEEPAGRGAGSAAAGGEGAPQVRFVLIEKLNWLWWYLIHPSIYPWVYPPHIRCCETTPGDLEGADVIKRGTQLLEVGGTELYLALPVEPLP